MRRSCGALVALVVETSPPTFTEIGARPRRGSLCGERLPETSTCKGPRRATSEARARSGEKVRAMGELEVEVKVEVALASEEVVGMPSASPALSSTLGAAV